MEVLKSTRRPADGKAVYQIEYVQRNGTIEYRLRRGSYGSFTRWFETDNLSELLVNCGFNIVSAVKPAHDFYVNSHFGRGTFNLTLPMVQEIASGVEHDSIARRMYSRLKRTGDKTWTVPILAIDNTEHFNYLYRLIKKYT